MSFSESVFLFFLALIIFGPKKLPEIARQAGKLLNEFRRASNEFRSQIEQEIAHIEVENKRQTALQPSPPPAGTESRMPTAATTPSSPGGTTESSSQLASQPQVEDEPLFASASDRAAEPAFDHAQEPPPNPSSSRSSSSLSSITPSEKPRAPEARPEAVTSSAPQEHHA